MLSEQAVLPDHVLLHVNLEELGGQTLLLLRLTRQALHQLLLSQCLLQGEGTDHLAGFGVRVYGCKITDCVVKERRTREIFDNTCFKNLVAPLEPHGPGAAPPGICLVFSLSARELLRSPPASVGCPVYTCY